MSLASLPSGFNQEFVAAQSLSALVRRPVEPVGRYFLAHAARTLRGHTWSDFEKLQAEKNVVKAEDVEDEDDFDEEQSAELLAHDPREWQTADLYAVLGLSKYRYKATQEQIRKAHRKAVLKHHPDKKSASGGLEQDGFFKIIQKAVETMMDPIKRRQFDSVDTNADVPAPDAKTQYDFFEAWTPFFESEARFSNKKPVPSLGDINSSKKDVDAFYSFWYSFDSWRSFEFLDEDVPDDTANRDHKRYIERKNVAARKKKKTEDNKRLIDLVKRASAEDPRIKLFKEAEKKEKERKKWERDAGSRKAAEELALKKAAEEAAKLELETAAKLAKENNKKAKEAAKSAKKKNKRSIRNAVKEASHFGDADKATVIDADVDLLIDSFDDLQLGSVASSVGDGSDAAAVKKALEDVATELVGAGKVSSSSLKYFGK